MKYCLQSAGGQATTSFAAGGDFAQVPPIHMGFELQQRVGKTVMGIPGQTPSLLPDLLPSALAKKSTFLNAWF